MNKNTNTKKSVENQKKAEALSSISKSLPLPNPSNEDIGKAFSAWKGTETERSTPKQTPSQTPSKPKIELNLI